MARHSNNNNNPDATAQDNSQWTTDQDGAICKLVKDGVSWAKIASTIGRRKALVHRRFDYIKSQIEAAGLDTDSIGETWAEDMRQQGKEIPSPDKKRKPQHPAPSTPAPTEAAAASSPEVFDLTGFGDIMMPSEEEQDNEEEKKKEREGKGKQKKKEPVKQQSQPPVHARGGGHKKANNKNHNNKQTNTKNKETASEAPKTGKVKLSGGIIKKNGVRFAEIVVSSSSSSAASSSSSSSSSSDEEDSDDDEDEREEQKRFLYYEYWSEMYPDQKNHAPDRFWSEGDCKVLAVIEAKDEALKYKRMQADFFNATGRMISDQVIKYKMQQGE